MIVYFTRVGSLRFSLSSCHELIIFMKTKTLLSILFVVAAVGCAGGNNSDSTGVAGSGDSQTVNSSADIYSDEASAQERGLIEEQMSIIKGFAAEFGVTTDLDRIPIFVSSDASIPATTPSFCIMNGTVGTKIVLNKNFFKERVYEKDTGLASPLFNLLIHEIGHCYMGRSHEEALLKKRGYMAEFDIVSSKGRDVARFYSVQSTMMHNTYFAMPKTLEKYFVGEIFGKWRARSLDQLQSQYDFRLVLTNDPEAFL